MRNAAKRDDNHRQVVAGLRAAGAFVQDMGAVGSGVADLMVGYRGQWHILEVKNGEKCHSRRALTPRQIAWLFDIRNRAPVHVVESVEQALGVIGAGHARG